MHMSARVCVPMRARTRRCYVVCACVFVCLVSYRHRVGTPWTVPGPGLLFEVGNLRIQADFRASNRDAGFRICALLEGPKEAGS